MTDDKQQPDAPKDDTDTLRANARPGGLTKPAPDKQDNLGKKRGGG